MTTSYDYDTVFISLDYESVVKMLDSLFVVTAWYPDIAINLLAIAERLRSVVVIERSTGPRGSMEVGAVRHMSTTRRWRRRLQERAL